MEHINAQPISSVLVIGGGFAGTSAARALRKSSRVRVTLVDRKDYFEVTPAQFRALVSPETVGGLSRIPYRDLVGDSFVQGEVSSLEDRAAVLADGTRLVFDQVILAVGTSYPRFSIGKPTTQTTKALRWAHNLEEHARFLSAPGYLVVGGGVVGVELAAELASWAPDKPVRLAHNGPRLVENLDPKASAVALDHLTRLGVNVLLNTGDARPENGELLYTTVSPEPATGFLKNSVPEILDARGRIMVDPFLRVKGKDGWFAVGDATDAPDGKQASNAGAQGEYAAKVLLSPTKVPKPYKPQPVMALVPLGKTHGFAQLPFGVVTWKFLVGIKRKDGLVSMFRQRFGLGKV